MKPDEREAAAEWVPIDKLLPWASNPRKNDKAMLSVAKSIKRFGFGSPILARKADGEVIAGHTRLRAAQHLKLKHVPVRYMDLDPADAHLLALADNKLGEIAEWDDAGLVALLSQFTADDAKLAGFGAEDLERLGSELLGSEPVDPIDDGELVDHAEELRKKWGTAEGQLWVIPSASLPNAVHQMLCGDCTDGANVKAAAGSELCDMCWTDPPYGVSYVGKQASAMKIQNDKLSPEALQSFLMKAFAHASSVLRPGAAVYVAHPPGALSLQFRLAFDAAGFRFHEGLVWKKDSMVLGHSDYHYMHEPIMLGYTPAPPGEGRPGRGGDRWFGDNSQVSVFDVARPKASDEHPTTKPVELISPMVRNSSPPGGKVYEPFGGSGSTMSACEQSRRTCASLEIDPKYVAVALERMERLGCKPRLSP